jgi:hypothetical protein
VNVFVLPRMRSGLNLKNQQFWLEPLTFAKVVKYFRSSNWGTEPIDYRCEVWCDL